MSSKAEQAVAYTALILADNSIPITPEKLQALLNAAGIKDVEPIWTALFAKALEGKDVKEILTAVVATGPATGEVVSTKVEDGRMVKGPVMARRTRIEEKTMLGLTTMTWDWGFLTRDFEIVEKTDCCWGELGLLKPYDSCETVQEDLSSTVL